MGSAQSITVDKFTGLNKTKDYLSVLPGQLTENYNYLYMPSGGLQERGGGVKLSNPPAAGAVYSLANFRGASATEYLITNQGTDAYYYTTAWNALSLTLTSNLTTRWAEAGQGALRAIYGVNGTDSVTKIVEVTGTPTGSAVSGSPTAATQIILHKNRLFALAGDTLYFTESLSFDEWNTNENTIEIAPGRDGTGKTLAIWGDTLYIFKDYGVYALPNADDISPKLNWVILRTDASNGTQSPDSVKETTRGIFYLDPEANVQTLGPNTTFGTGEYTLGDSGSKIISEAIKDEINSDVDRTALARAAAIFHNNLYIISWQSNAAATNYNDKTYFADVDKWAEWPGIQDAQPYWGEFTGFNYQFYARQTAAGKVKLYGAKGVSTIGSVQETLNDTVNNDNTDGIDAYAVLGWLPINGASSYKNFKQIYMIADTENWNINVTLNAYKYEKSLPQPGDGINRAYSTQSLAGVGLVGSAIVGTSITGNIGISSNKMNFSLKGYYFKAEFRNANADEFTRIDKIIVYYRVIKNK